MTCLPLVPEASLPPYEVLGLSFKDVMRNQSAPEECILENTCVARGLHTSINEVDSSGTTICRAVYYPQSDHVMQRSAMFL